MTWQPGKPIQIKTNRFILRSILPRDVNDTYISWWNDREIQKGFNFKPRGWGRKEALKHVSRFNNKDSFHLGIFDKASGALIGFYTMFIYIQPRRALTNVCVGDKAWWGKGVVLEVRGKMLDFLFFNLDLEKVEGTIHGRNLPSIYNYKAQGFRTEAIVRSHMVGAYGGRVDEYHFGMLKEEWLEKRKESPYKDTDE